MRALNIRLIQQSTDLDKILHFFPTQCVHACSQTLTLHAIKCFLLLLFIHFIGDNQRNHQANPTET